MIADIALVVGPYLVRRMVPLLTRKGDRAKFVVVKVLAVTTMLVTVICAADLLMRGQATA